MNDGMYLVEHVKRTEAGQTKMQIKLPISLRAGMAALSKRLGISQLAIVRSALAAYLLANAEPVTAMAVPPEVTPLPAQRPPPRLRPRRSPRHPTEAPAEEATEAQPAVAPLHPNPRSTEANAHRLHVHVLSYCRVSPLMIFRKPLRARP